MTNKPDKKEQITENTDRKAGSAQGDPMLECLVFLTEHYGRAKSAEAIKAGLAYDEKGMGPNLFCEAADRLGLKAKVLRRDLGKVTAPVLPTVIILKKDQCCVLVGLNNGKAKIFLPETKTTKEIAYGDLEKAYAGYVIYVHPRAEFTDPEAPNLDHTGRHWFWGVVTDNLGIYGRVLIAAVMINMFAIVGPLFIMNVYDRVIPNNATDTGWVLAIGALSAYVFNVILMTLRGYFIDLAGRS